MSASSTNHFRAVDGRETQKQWTILVDSVPSVQHMARALALAAPADAKQQANMNATWRRRLLLMLGTSGRSAFT